MANYHDFRIGKNKFTLWLDTKRHVWKVFFGDSVTGRNPDLEFTQAKGDTVFEFVKELEKRDMQGST